VLAAVGRCRRTSPSDGLGASVRTVAATPGPGAIEGRAYAWAAVSYDEMIADFARSYEELLEQLRDRSSERVVGLAILRQRH